jgi:hypothetical protein
MAFENFRRRCGPHLADFEFSDDDIRAAVYAVRARGLQPVDKYVLAQLKIAYMGRIMKNDGALNPQSTEPSDGN